MNTRKRKMLIFIFLIIIINLIVFVIKDNTFIKKEKNIYKNYNLLNNKNIISQITNIKKQLFFEKKEPIKKKIISENNIEKYIQEKGYKVSIGYYNLVSEDNFYYKEDKLYYGASLIKSLDAIYFYEMNLVTDEIEPYIMKAISQSDNLSHQYLVKYIGRQTLKDYGRSLGAENTLLGNDNYGNTTVKDQIIYLKKLYQMIETNEKLKSYFINDYGNYLKIDGITILHKYGYISKYYHDVGIFLDSEPYILVVLTEHGNNNYKAVIKDISNIIYKYHKEK